MKATMMVPDELYRSVKTKSAALGLTVREVTVDLFRRWVTEVETPSAIAVAEAPPTDWFAESGRDRLAAAEAEIKVVGKSGQISLGKRYTGKLFELRRLEDGSVLLRAVAMVPESQLWTLQEPDRSRIARGLAWAATTERKESSLDSLVKRSGKRRSQPVGRKK